MKERCARCGGVGHDRRTLWMSCFYNMEVLPIPFEMCFSVEHPFYTLRVCKDCRADWLASLCTWFSSPPTIRNPDAEHDIPIRENGVTTFITLAELLARKGTKENA